MQTIDDKQHTDHIDTIDGKRNSLEDEGVAAYVPDSPEEKRLVRKIDKHLLPMLWIMYIMNYIDRTNIGNVSIYCLCVCRMGLTDRPRRVVWRRTGTCLVSRLHFDIHDGYSC